MAVAVEVVHRSQPGRRDAVRDVWMAHMPAAVRDNAGHLAYFYTFDSADVDVIRAFQVYTDEAAAAAFLETSEYAAYVSAVEPNLSGPPEVLRSSVEWAKGI